MSLNFFRPFCNVFDRDGCGILNGDLRVLSQTMQFSCYQLTFSFACSVPWENIRVAELFNSTNLASSSSHFLVNVPVRRLERIRIQVLFGYPRTNEAVLFPRVVTRVVSSSLFPSSPVPRKVEVKICYTV